MKPLYLPYLLAFCLLVSSPDDMHAAAVSAANDEGESAKTAAPTTPTGSPPSAPTLLRVTRLSATQNKIEWNHAGGNVTEFHLYRAKGDEEWDYFWGNTTDATQFKPVVIPAGSNSYTDDRADADFSYRYVVKATNEPSKYENFSEPSNGATEYSAKVTLVAGVGRTPLPSNHPKPTGTVSMTNVAGKPDDILTGPYSTYTPYGPPENGEQAAWSGSLASFRKTGETYTEDVSVQVDAKLIASDPEHPIYDIGDLLGSVGTGTTSSVLGAPGNYYLAPDRSRATFTSHGQRAIFRGKLEPSPTTSLAYDFASNPRWLALPGSGSKQVRFTLAPARPDLTKHFAIGGNIQVSPADTTSADQTLTVQSQSDISEQQTLSASVDAGEVARLRVDMRMHRTMAVAMIVLTQDYGAADRKGVINPPIPPNKAPTRDQLETFLNSVFEPQMNITVTVTKFEAAKDYDCGVTDEFLDITNPKEQRIIADLINQHNGFDKYLFFVHAFGWAGKTLEISAQGIAPNLILDPNNNNYCLVHDVAVSPLVTAAHELGHTLGLYHLWASATPHRGYAPYDSYSQRMMGAFSSNRRRYSQAEREISYKALADIQQNLP